LFLVDDHPVVRKGISSCLSRLRHIEVVGEAGDGKEALRKIRELAPDLVLMDVEMPEMDGLAVTELLRRELPKINVLVLSMHSSPEYVKRILQSGARGYVLKGASPEELARAIEVVQSGEAFFSPEVARMALNQVMGQADEKGQGATLTRREKEVLTHIAEGLSNKEIATRLDVGVRTVETHRERIMRKLNIHSIAGLTKYAIANGLISLRQ
jgi:two-component system, NarL family, nitrate/nitrite response regulator NarL